MKLVDVRDSTALEEAVALLKAGEIVAYPTETVYGLAVDPFNTDALDKLFAAKGRDREKAILLIVGSASHLQDVVLDLSKNAERLMERFWPGPLSLVLPKHPRLPEGLAPGLEKICVRCPGAAFARRLCDAFGGPLTSTSANASGEAPVISLSDLSLRGVALGLDAGALPPSPPSTIFDPDTRTILREGALSRSELMRFGAITS